jgi:hypothetical protein
MTHINSFSLRPLCLCGVQFLALAPISRSISHSGVRAQRVEETLRPDDVLFSIPFRNKAKA